MSRTRWRFVEDAESAWRTGHGQPALAAAATAASLAVARCSRPSTVPGSNGGARSCATLLRALDVLVDGLAGSPFEQDASDTPVKPWPWIRTGRPATSGSCVCT